MSGYKRFLLAMAALLITGYVYISTGTVEAFFAGLTTLAFDWFFKAHEEGTIGEKKNGVEM